MTVEQVGVASSLVNVYVSVCVLVGALDALIVRVVWTVVVAVGDGKLKQLQALWATCAPCPS